MSKNIVRENFVANSFVADTMEWTAPAGVKKLKVLCKIAEVYNISRAAANLAMAGISEPSGTLVTWGSNTSGQLGDGTVVAKSSPVAVVGANSAAYKFKSVASGSNQHHALDQEGRVWSWGSNFNGQLGDNTVVSKSSPVLVQGAGWRFKKLSAGGDFAVGLTPSGLAVTWGRNSDGQLGSGNTTPRSTPVAVVGNNIFKEVVAGYEFCLALKEDGTLWAWGKNDSGQLCDGATVISKSSPVAVAGGVKFSKIAAGQTHALGIGTDGKLYSWGSNFGGQLGDGTLASKSTPTLVNNASWVADGRLVDIVAASDYSFALDNVGVIYSWGRNVNGQLGDGTVVGKSSPVFVTGVTGGNLIGSRFVKIGSAVNCGFAQNGFGDVYGWGGNVAGLIGDGTSVAKSSPVLLAFSRMVKNLVADQEFILDVEPGSTYFFTYTTGFVAFGSKILSTEICKAVYLEYEA